MTELGVVTLLAFAWMRTLLILVLWRQHVHARATHGASVPDVDLDELDGDGCDADELAACTHDGCGKRFTEDEIERSQGWCPACGGKWVGTEDRKP